MGLTLYKICTSLKISTGSRQRESKDSGADAGIRWKRIVNEKYRPYRKSVGSFKGTIRQKGVHRKLARKSSKWPVVNTFADKTETRKS